jgi:photosystem II stability/assembly factor-like uncharacterized protein
MPDTELDAELARLRDGVRGSLPVPGFDQVVTRHRQRVVRRRMQVGAVAAVLAVSVAVPVLREQMVPDPAPPATPPDTPRSSFVSAVDFADPEHGYAIRTTCETRVSCADQLLTTGDGSHWRTRPLPRPDPAPSWARGHLQVLGRDELTVDWPLSAALEDTQVHRVYSTDGGASWESVRMPSVVTATVASIPDGASLSASCARLVPGGQRCAERGFAVTLPGSGRPALLANRPPLTAMVAGAVPNGDGSWWVAGRDPKTDRWGLAVSRDDGRTWTTVVLALRETVDQRGWSVNSHGDTLYATAVGALPDTSNGLLAIYRSTDGGRSWQQTWRPAGGEQPRRVFANTVVGEDGTLTICTPDNTMYVSRDGGRTFTAAKARYGGYAVRTRIGYLAAAAPPAEGIVASGDGVHWRELDVP